MHHPNLCLHLYKACPCVSLGPNSPSPLRTPVIGSRTRLGLRRAQLSSLHWQRPYFQMMFHSRVLGLTILIRIFLGMVEGIRFNPLQAVWMQQWEKTNLPQEQVDCLSLVTGQTSFPFCHGCQETKPQSPPLWKLSREHTDLDFHFRPRLMNGFYVSLLYIFSRCGGKTGHK